jgi:transcriptional regulator with XRE-family HTH domain
MGKHTLNKTPNDVLTDIANKVKIIRKSKGLTQLNLADKSGVSYGSIKRFETTGQISLDSLLRVAHVLGKLSDFDLILVDNKDNDVSHLFSI